jgi:hypothetical protein
MSRHGPERLLTLRAEEKELVRNTLPGRQRQNPGNPESLTNAT